MTYEYIIIDNVRLIIVLFSLYLHCLFKRKKTLSLLGVFDQNVREEII